MWASTASAIRSSFCVVLNTHFFLSSSGVITADEPTVVSSGVFDSATKSSIASAAGVVVGPISASTLCSPISFLTPVTACVGSDASSRTMYSTLRPAISVGNSAAVFFCGMPTMAVGPVEEAMMPTFRSAWTRPLATRAVSRANERRRASMQTPVRAKWRSAHYNEPPCSRPPIVRPAPA